MGAYCCAFGDVVAVRWEHSTTACVERFQKLVYDTYAANKGPLLILSIIDERTGLIDTEVREAMEKMGAEISPLSRGNLLIVLGSGAMFAKFMSTAILTFKFTEAESFRNKAGVYRSVEEALREFGEDTTHSHDEIIAELKTCHLLLDSNEPS